MNLVTFILVESNQRVKEVTEILRESLQCKLDRDCIGLIETQSGSYYRVATIKTAHMSARGMGINRLIFENCDWETNPDLKPCLYPVVMSSKMYEVVFTRNVSSYLKRGVNTFAEHIDWQKLVGALMDQRTIELQNQFGYVEGETCCQSCGALLTREHAHWAFGAWWHRYTASCVMEKKKNEEDI